MYYTVLRMNDNFSEKELQTAKILRNYFVHQGRIPSVRKLMNLLGYKSPRSVSIIINSLVEKNVLKKRDDGSLIFLDLQSLSKSQAHTVDVPILGMVACGSPIFAEENIEGVVKVSIKMAPISSKHFILRVSGDSMNLKGINDGDLVLLKQQQIAQDGQDVLALIDDEATIKEYHREKNTVVLRPCSDNPTHKSIILTDDFLIQGVVVTTIPEIK